MKFFCKKNIKNTLKKNPKKISYPTILWTNTNTFNTNIFTRFLVNRGLLLKEKNNLSTIFKNFNHFLYNESQYIYENYPFAKGALENLFQKNFNCIYIFDIVVDLVKPPFIVKSVSVPKKLRKRTKQKYLIKIVYKNDKKRLKGAYKQLYYYSKTFTDINFKTRLYKSLMFSFLD